MCFLEVEGTPDTSYDVKNRRSVGVSLASGYTIKIRPLDELLHSSPVHEMTRAHANRNQLLTYCLYSPTSWFLCTHTHIYAGRFPCFRHGVRRKS
jgi:hypothetical protein